MKEKQVIGIDVLSQKLNLHFLGTGADFEIANTEKSEGKPTRIAIIAVARKLCERVFAVVKKGEPYEIRNRNPL
jgi:hypothetical protein